MDIPNIYKIMLQQYPSSCQHKTPTVDNSTNGDNADKRGKRNGQKEKKDKIKYFVFDDRMWSTTGCLEKSTIHDRHNGECW